MEQRYPRGTLPPSAFVAIDPSVPRKKLTTPPPSTLERSAGTSSEAPRGTCDLASTCPTCGTLMQPEHAHYRCQTCGYRDSCCF